MALVWYMHYHICYSVWLLIFFNVDVWVNIAMQSSYLPSSQVEKPADSSYVISNNILSAYSWFLSTRYQVKNLNHAFDYKDSHYICKQSGVSIFFTTALGADTDKHAGLAWLQIKPEKFSNFGQLSFCKFVLNFDRKDAIPYTFNISIKC